MIFAEVRPFLSGRASTAQLSRQSRQNSFHIAGKDTEFIPNLGADSEEKSGLHREYRVNESMRASQHAGQERNVFRSRPRLGLHAIDGSERVRASESRRKTEAIQVGWRDAWAAFEI